jgi:hypothetical protein
MQQNNQDFIGVMSNNEILYANHAIGNQPYNGTVGTLSYAISSAGAEKCSVKIDEVEYALQRDGITL